MTNVLTFDICALAIVLVFLVSTIVRKQVTGRTNFILFLIMVFIAIATACDMASGFLVDYAEKTACARLALYLVNFFYFLFHNLILPLYVLYIYSSNDLWHVLKKKEYLRLTLLALSIIPVIILLLNGILFDVFSASENIEYVRGPWIASFYAVAVILGGWGLACLIYYRKLIKKDKFIVLLFLFGIIAGGMVVQLFKAGYMVEMFSVTLALLFFMVVVQREENQIDIITGANKYISGVEVLSKAFKTKKPISVIFIKINNCNNLVLYLGQEQFNLMLRTVTDEFTFIARENEFPMDIFYLESGLFAMVSECKDEEKIADVAYKIEALMSQQLHVASFDVFTDTRLCVVNCPEDVNDFSTLYTLGNSFHNTLPSNNGVCFYSAYKFNREFKMRSEMDGILQRALNAYGFEMYYQPIYSTTQHRFVAAEALIRLYDKGYGFISPGVFIPISEMNGTIHEIGDFTLREVIKFISEFDIKSYGLDYIEVNLSASQCIEVDLVDKILGLLEEYNVEPGMLSLELTETSANVNPVIVDQNVQALTKYGVRFALDDYGTGYSNIKRVTALPIKQVKMDKTFVDQIDNPNMWIVIQDTIKMLKEMGKEILVEGVEEERVVRKFTELDTDLIQGCDLIQGFYFCKPLPKGEFIKFMENHISIGE